MVWDLANGFTLSYGFGAEQIPGTPIVFLVLLAAFAVLALAYFAYRRGRLTPLDGYGLIVLGALALLVLFIQFSGLKDEAAQEGIYIEFQLGLWGTVLSFIAIAIGGVLNLKEP